MNQNNREMMAELMTELVDTVRGRRPDAVYRLDPVSGWRDWETDTPVETPVVGLVPCERLEPALDYVAVHDGGRIVWRLMRVPEVPWYYLNQLEIDTNDTVIYRYYGLALAELTERLLEQLSPTRDE